MYEYRSAEWPINRDSVDSMECECPVPEFENCNTLGRSTRANWNGVRNNDITALDYDRGTMDLEAATLEVALRTGGLVYGVKGPYTCFVPSGKAFALLSKEYAENLFRDEKKLVEVLKSHTVRGKIMYKDIKKAKTVKNLAGKELKIDSSDEASVGGAKIISPDIEAGNGVIHIIDTLLTV
jgi:uncharacterized surface protein with fasciclin (FAS1) repeats